MYTFPAATLGQKFVSYGANIGPGAIIAPPPKKPFAQPRKRKGQRRPSAFFALILVLVLSACSTARLVYNQAPTLAYWWVDDFVNLSDAQSAPLREDIDALFTWHRTQELPTYAERLKAWRQLATQDLTAEQACQQFDEARAAYLHAVDRSVAPFTRLALSLQPSQIQHLEARQRKGQAKYEKEWLSGGRAQSQAHRLEKAVERYETLYGKLSKAQRARLDQQAQVSEFDPERLRQERLRRNTDLVNSIRQSQAQPSHAAAILRSWHDRVMDSPDPTYAAYSKALVREGCVQFASLHNSTSKEQRLHAEHVIQGYENDIAALLRND